MSTDTILDQGASPSRSNADRIEILIQRIEAALLHVTEWSDVPERDSCAHCDARGESEWIIQGIEGADHGLLSDEYQARFIALLNPRNVRMLLDVIAEHAKTRSKS